MVNIKFNPKYLQLEVIGHAGSGKKGEDIVCSAISTLFYTLGETLMQSAEMLVESPVVVDKEGNGVIVCTPKAEYEGNIACIYRTVLIGLQMVAEHYPEYATFTVVEE